jgi:hypothetical protein
MFSVAQIQMKKHHIQYIDEQDIEHIEQQPSFDSMK